MKHYWGKNGIFMAEEARIKTKTDYWFIMGLAGLVGYLSGLIGSAVECHKTVMMIVSAAIGGLSLSAVTGFFLMAYYYFQKK
ncbi:MAG TPA: hypothetical protein VJB02_00945 [Coxiellaceae bacterium]|nr:hypothetical protein [Coxiellaceae bacterium]